MCVCVCASGLIMLVCTLVTSRTIFACRIPPILSHSQHTHIQAPLDITQRDAIQLKTATAVTKLYQVNEESIECSAIRPVCSAARGRELVPFNSKVAERPNEAGLRS